MPDWEVPVVPGVKASGFLILEATRYVGGRVREMKIARVTQNPRHRGQQPDPSS